MASALRTDRRCFRLLSAGDPAIVALREWSRIAEDLGAERNRLTNRMREQFWRYFPAFLELDGDLAAEWLLDLWAIASTPGKAARVHKATVAKILKRHRIRRLDAAGVLAVLRQPPLEVAAGTVEAACAHIATLIERVRLVNRQIKDANRQLDALIAHPIPADPIPAEENEAGQSTQRVAEILASLPGVGRIVLATLLAEGFDALRRRDFPALRSLTGIAPVTKRSGKSCIVVRRYGCHRRLGNAMYHWARVAVQIDAISRDKYAALRSRGHSHARALRSVADRLLNVACSMLKSDTLFEPERAQKNAC